ncbi:uncharacterized protein LOC120770555 isoform X2 [Bactrocera tryoni]|uniref:uncharacterized protein LOC120770555 isoform X2 n=1 Tax=Bactrocera tryoni TaxID=59916 RepID=UPI001A95B02F|nr:uncharacterized protein LOC120770555 isoform X2 [Bactrocera tryoni]
MDPTNTSVKSECEFASERITNDFTTMHNNQYNKVPSNFHGNNSGHYVNYQTYIHNSEDLGRINEHGIMHREASFDQMHCGQNIKSESEYSFLHTNADHLSNVEKSNKSDVQTAECDDIPVIVNGKYFKIIEEMSATEHQRVTRGIVAVCQHCPREKVRSIQGSMRITSNFVRHLKTLHPEKYEEFIIERQNHSRTPRGRRTQKRKASQLGEGQNENNSRTENYMNDDNKEQSSEGASIYIDDMQPTSVNNSNNLDNSDLYSAESNDTHISEESLEKRETVSTCQLTCDPNEIPTILNGKYFKIVEQDMSSNRVSISVVAACQFCDNDKFVKGPLRVTSNFVQHLRSCHFKEYNMYLQEKFNSSTRCRRSLNRQQTQLPFVEKVLNFILLSNIPVSVLEEPSFVELFRNTGLTMCSCAQLLARLDDMHVGFVENIKRNLEEIPYICGAADIWTSRKTHYFGYSIFWLDNELKRQMAVLACVKLSNSPTHKEIEAVITQIQNKYDLSDEKIIYNVIDNVRDFVQTYHNFSIKSICPDDHNDDLNISYSNAQGLLNQLSKQFKHGEHSLHLLTVFDFDRILKSHDRLQHALTRCLILLNKCSDVDANEIARFLFEGHLPLSDVRWPIWYTSLTQLIKEKHKINELCNFLNQPKLVQIDIEYLEDFCMILKPIADAIEFLQQGNYLYFGYFLPSLVTIKVKLKKLHESRHIKHLHTVAQNMSDALLCRLRSYFEVTPECNDALIAAVVCPAVKMRFVEALRETAPNITTDRIMLLFIDYAQEFYIDNEQAEDLREQRPPSVDSFLCFNPDDNEDPPLDNKPCIAIRREFSSYLHDDDKTLSCLNRYPIVKKVFLKYNTLPATSMLLEKFFRTFLNVINGQKGQHLTDEHLERLVLTKVNKIL